MSLYYFAYGSNMFSKRMLERIPEAVFDEIACLSGWRLVWDKISKDGSGKANLQKEENGKVWGVVYRIPAEKTSKLDKVEGGYQRIDVEVQLRNQDKRLVFTYVSEKRDANLVPYAWYKALVLEGAQEHSLPNEYIELIKQVVAKPNPRHASGVTHGT